MYNIWAFCRNAMLTKLTKGTNEVSKFQINKNSHLWVMVLIKLALVQTKLANSSFDRWRGLSSNPTF